MFKIWTTRLFLATLLAMVGSLYIAVGTNCATPETKTEAVKEEPKDIPVSDTSEAKEILKLDTKKSAAELFEVPRTYLANFPKDMRQVKNRKEKKDMFVHILLPMILHENEIIMRERALIIELKKAHDSGKALKHSDTFWLNKVCEKYKMKHVDFKELLRRVDIIPPSLALGQATIESGMGISYAALKKNSPFGMTVSQKVLAYKSLSESVAAYIRNLNSNNAYRTMRATRAELRASNKDIDGNVLIGDLIAYCETGKYYIKQVRSAIKCNDLLKYDSISLEPKTKA